MITMRLFLVKHILTLALLCFFCVVPLQGEIIDRVVAVVNEEVITLSELLQIAQGQSQNSPAMLSQENYRNLLNQIIDQKLVDQEALKAEIKVTDREVGQAIEGIKKRNQLTDEQFYQALGQQGLTREEYREKMREELLRSQVIAQKVQSQVNVSDKEVKKYFQEHGAEYFEPARVKIEQVFMPLPPDATAEAQSIVRLKAEQALKRIQSGEDFHKVAQDYNDLSDNKLPSDPGYFKKGELLGPLDEAAFTLKIGSVSDVISTNKGVFIIRVLERTEETTKTPDEVREQITNVLFQQKMEKKFEGWIKELHSKAYIEIKI